MPTVREPDDSVRLIRVEKAGVGQCNYTSAGFVAVDVATNLPKASPARVARVHANNTVQRAAGRRGRSLTTERGDFASASTKGGIAATSAILYHIENRQ